MLPPPTPHPIESVRLRLTFAALACAVDALAQPAILALAEVKPGMRATGRTIFSGANIEEFQAEILGVLENVAPKQSIILARLSGGPLDRTVVLQGMSGSRVYISGKLIGAVALSFPFSKEHIAGIRPIQEMLTSASTPAPSAPNTPSTSPRSCPSAPNTTSVPRASPKSPRPSGSTDSPPARSLLKASHVAASPTPPAPSEFK